MSIQGKRPGLAPLLHDLASNGKASCVKVPSRIYVASQATAGIGPGMNDLEVVTFYPKHDSRFSQIKVTSPKGKFQLHRTYRVYFELQPIEEPEGKDSLQ